MKPAWERAAGQSAVALMNSKDITAKEADELLEHWESLSLRVCFAVCIGELAWHAHWVGTIRNASVGRWVLVSGQTTNMLSTAQYKEIVLTEDDELLGLRFRQPEGGAGFRSESVHRQARRFRPRCSTHDQQNRSVTRTLKAEARHF
jgi:hypothetical protein